MQKILAFTFGDKTVYVSPYHTTECPVETVIIYNPSAHANNVAITKLKQAWPNLRILQCVLEGKPKNPQINEEDVIRLPKGTKDVWKNPEIVYTKYQALLEKRPELRPDPFSPKPGPGLYCAWSAQAEDPKVARKAIESKFVWIGASPESMEIIGTKIDYKQHCDKIGVKTAPFFVLETQDDPKQDLTAYINDLVQQLRAKYDSGELAGQSIFLKSSYGGGGRGTIRIAAEDCSNDAVLSAKLKKVITDTCRTELYVEKALDLKGATMYQLELETDGDRVVKGGRLVWFNNNNQKILEIGLSDEEMLKFVPKEVYDQCRAETEEIAKTAGYNNRGTNEILLTKKSSSWDYWHSEFNCRIQVEHEALANLTTDTSGQVINAPANQLMRAVGYPAPQPSDTIPVQNKIVAHLRLVNAHAEAKPTPWAYNGGTIYDIQNIPEGVDVLINRGKIDKATDAQCGRMTFYADSWTDVCDKIGKIASETVIVGEGGVIGKEYFEFLLKLSQDPEFRAQELGCDRTSEMVKKPNAPLSKRSEITAKLAASVAPVLVDGYQPNYTPEAGKAYPTTAETAAFNALKAELAGMEPVEAPLFTTLVEGSKANDISGYYDGLRAQLERQGGGINTVFPRDVYQEGMNSQSAVTLDMMKAIMEKVGASLFTRYETGGAQFDKACLDGFNPREVFRKGITNNMPSMCLTRSQWLNSLNPKTPKELDFILKDMAKIIREELGLPEDTLIPWFPNNFHAGNWDNGKNITTDLMLKNGMTPVPNWAWDPRYKDADIRGWAQSQIALFKSHGRSLEEIRIKNPGQQTSWTVDEIWKISSILREECKNAGFRDPIIHIHNHNIDGKAAEIAHGLLKRAQSEGYRLFVIDTAPPETTHNNNLTVAAALNLDATQRKALETYNRMCQTVFKFTGRFDIRQTMKSVTPDDSVWAGGTGSSDLDSALKIGIKKEDITKAKMLAWGVFGLGTVVTPFSEVLKRLGYTIWKNDKIVEKTREGVIRYIKEGGKLDIDAPTLKVLQSWESRLPRPEIVDQLLINHGMKPIAPAIAPVDNFDPEIIRQDLMVRFPNLDITEEHIMIYVAYGASGLGLLKLMNDRSDLSWALSNPEFLLQDPENHKVGLQITVNGELLTLTEKERDPETGIVTLSFTDKAGEIYTVKKLDTHYAIEEGIIIAPVLVQPGDITDIGAIGEGDLTRVLVKPGDILKKGDVMAILTIAKEEKELTVPDHMVGMVVEETFKDAGDPVVLYEKLFKVRKATESQ